MLRAARRARVVYRRAARAGEERRHDRARHRAAPPAAPRRRRRDDEAQARLEGARAPVRARLRRALLAAHQAGERRLRLRLPRGHRADGRAGNSLAHRDETMTSMIRRRLLAAAAALPVVPAFAQTRQLTCGELTAQQTEGPFFKTSTPLRVSLLEPQSRTPRLIVTGQVLSARCQPVANALLDFWHADEDGEYDTRGFRYRGHQFTDAQGSYRLQTIVPAEYPGRARHIHVKVQAPGKRVLTTQLYFPGDPGNAKDGLYERALERSEEHTSELQS